MAVSRSASPIASASAPFACPPVYISSSARCWPTTAGSVTEMPKPWWKPSRAKLQLKRVSGVATRKSAASARPRPPPTAAPCTAATIGLRAEKSRDGLLVEVRGAVDEVDCGPEVGAGAEVLALRAQHDGPARGVVVEPEDGVDERRMSVDVEEVVGRAVDLDRRDVVLDGDGDVLGHGARTLPPRFRCHTVALRGLGRGCPAVHKPLMFRRLSR